MYLEHSGAPGKRSMPSIRVYEIKNQLNVACDRMLGGIQYLSSSLPADMENRPSVLDELFAMNSFERVYASLSAAELDRCDRELKSALPVAKLQLLNMTTSDLPFVAMLIGLLRDPDDRSSFVRLLGPRTVSIEDQSAGVPSPALAISGELRICGRPGKAGGPWRFHHDLLRGLLVPIQRVLLLPPGRRDDGDRRHFVVGEDAAWIVAQVATHGAWQSYLADIRPQIRVIRAAMLPRAWAGGRGSRADD